MITMLRRRLLLAMGLSYQDALSSIRFGLSRYNAEAEIQHVVDVLGMIVKQIRANISLTPKAHASEITQGSRWRIDDER